ncbi:hypothetical protein SARC_06246 [Sphaeroforma arctica JP610]|uniref:Uncharacterized protein n=1 Tax=Sphaeroforma arctica JP610 TaxID=667725 RepID=A0A0L0FX59_9EUKA|nr:hypothetical protein SARC_06246 [Sphaeroforma arctica JP610]KNC81430.1 hypothetical protein SARC_06246 [Sphaeroforma arctica JP610]|eukprot:XP_014155332.1 hypothetical protein SARC_06246 [Sphaeroforma arctica JP610]
MSSHTTFKRWVAKSVQGKDAQQYYSPWLGLYYIGGIFLDDNEVRNGFSHHPDLGILRVTTKPSACKNLPLAANTPATATMSLP